MKLASLKGGRDGRLIVVSRDLTRAADASAVAPTLRDALDDWAAAEPRLQEIADSLGVVEGQELTDGQMLDVTEAMIRYNR